jgi:dihydrofolate synthase/folylpolyglutamate synthase
MSLNDWLLRLESMHPKAIDMGLDRVAAVAQILGLTFSCPVITVGGTNGKGSTCAMLESILLQGGYRVGLYTSPHILHFNERARINGELVSDDALCAAFEKVDVARRDISLTYFEFSTLAILLLFVEVGLDAVILEVGLGGRLDAVNVIDADVAIVTSVDLDHQDYLGDTREAIGFEKAGIYRAGRAAICSDPAPPASRRGTWTLERASSCSAT